MLEYKQHTLAAIVADRHEAADVVGRDAIAVECDSRLRKSKAPSRGPFFSCRR